MIHDPVSDSRQHGMKDCSIKTTVIARSDSDEAIQFLKKDWIASLRSQ
jgi:hypothetical protein